MFTLNYVFCFSEAGEIYGWLPATPSMMQVSSRSLLALWRLLSDNFRHQSLSFLTFVTSRWIHSYRLGASGKLIFSFTVWRAWINQWPSYIHSPSHSATTLSRQCLPSCYFEGPPCHFYPMLDIINAIGSADCQCSYFRRCDFRMMYFGRFLI